MRKTRAGRRGEVAGARQEISDEPDAASEQDVEDGASGGDPEVTASELDELGKELERSMSKGAEVPTDSPPAVNATPEEILGVPPTQAVDRSASELPPAQTSASQMDGREGSQDEERGETLSVSDDVTITSRRRKNKKLFGSR